MRDRYFFLKSPFLLLLAFSFIFFSAPGQTFLVSIFFNELRGALNISHTFFASLYGLATILAAGGLPFLGAFLDRAPYEVSIGLMGIGMALGCYWVSLGMHSLFFLFIGFFMVRLLGQGGFAIFANKVIHQVFDRNKGIALGFIALAYPASELVFPIIGTVFYHIFGFSTSFILFSLMSILVMFSQFLWLRVSKMKGEIFKIEGSCLLDQSTTGFFQIKEIRNREKSLWSNVWGGVSQIHEARFYGLILANTIPGILCTGLFFYHPVLFERHSWPLFLLVNAMVVYAIMKAVGALLGGYLIDKYPNRYPFLLAMFFMGVASLMAGLGGGIWVLYSYFGLMGLSLGISAPVISNVWVSLYGNSHFSGISGVVAVFRNGLTGLGPIPLAICLDLNFSLVWVLVGWAFLIFLLMVIPYHYLKNDFKK